MNAKIQTLAQDIHAMTKQCASGEAVDMAILNAKTGLLVRVVGQQQADNLLNRLWLQDNV